jgi:hypothetical protein
LTGFTAISVVMYDDVGVHAGDPSMNSTKRGIVEAGGVLGSCGVAQVLMTWHVKEILAMHSLRPRNLRQHVTAAPSATREFTRPATLATACYCNSELDFTKPATPTGGCPPNFPSAISFSLSCATLFLPYTTHFSLSTLNDLLP